MSWFARLNPFRAPEAKQLTETDQLLAELSASAPTQAGVAVNVETALRVPAVRAAIQVIAEAVASLDVMVKQIAPDGTETDAPGHPVLPFLRDDANDWTDGYSLIRDLVADALMYDAGGLAVVNRASTGSIGEVIRYPRGVVGVEYDQATGEPSYRINGRPEPSQNIIHLRSPFGRAPLSHARESIGIAIVLERHAARLFGKGARPSGIVSFPKGYGEEAVKKVIAAFRRDHESEGNQGRTAFLFDGASFLPATFNSTDSQFLENRKFQIEEVSRAFRVPPSMLFHLDRATWSNTEQMGREFLTWCLEPWLRALEGALRRALFLPGDRGSHAIRFDRDDLTRADLQTRATTINSLIAARVINGNEGRHWLGLPPREGGNTFANPNIESGHATE